MTPNILHNQVEESRPGADGKELNELGVRVVRRLIEMRGDIDQPPPALLAEAEALAEDEVEKRFAELTTLRRKRRSSIQQLSVKALASIKNSFKQRTGSASVPASPSSSRRASSGGPLSGGPPSPLAKMSSAGSSPSILGWSGGKEEGEEKVHNTSLNKETHHPASLRKTPTRSSSAVHSRPRHDGSAVGRVQHSTSFKHVCCLLSGGLSPNLCSPSESQPQ